MNSETNLIWLDLEMSGLDPDKDVILQIAIIPTDAKLNQLHDGFTCYLTQPENILKNMNEWCQKHHQESGLIEKCLASKISLKQAQKLCLSYIKKWTQKEYSPLCGNTIGQDRRFLYRYMPEFCNFLNYRSIDVSSLKILKELYYPEVPYFPKKNTHDAFLDIQESILELKYYKKNLFQ